LDGGLGLGHEDLLAGAGRQHEHGSIPFGTSWSDSAGWESPLAALRPQARTQARAVLTASTPGTQPSLWGDEDVSRLTQPRVTSARCWPERSCAGCLATGSASVPWGALRP